MTYDENEAIRHIRKQTGNLLDPFDDDQILNVIDIVWDWQEANGYLDIDAGDDDDEIDVGALTAHALHLLGKDKGNKLPPECVRPLIEAELEFEDSVDEL